MKKSNLVKTLNSYPGDKDVVLKVNGKVVPFKVVADKDEFVLEAVVEEKKVKKVKVKKDDVTIK